MTQLIFKLPQMIRLSVDFEVINCFNEVIKKPLILRHSSLSVKIKLLLLSLLFNSSNYVSDNFQFVITLCRPLLTL